MGEAASGQQLTPPADVKDPELRRFLDECLPRIRAGLEPREFWVFGSRVNGAPDRWSDIDVLVVSERFRDVGVFDRLDLFRKHARPHRRVDALCVTPEEYETKVDQPTLVAEIVKHGLGVRII
ncbi:MAG: nucleotidyltransferase domain-containing protein [Armatimonadota bacterium]